jgi:hypothetical protein
MSKSEDNPDMKVLKTATCKTLSAKSTLTYQIGSEDDEIHVRITKNTGTLLSVSIASHSFAGSRPPHHITALFIRHSAPRPQLQGHGFVSAPHKAVFACNPAAKINKKLP